MDTTTLTAGIGSTIGKAFYLKNAKAILIEITSDLAADAAACHSVSIQHFFTFKYIKTDRAVGVSNFNYYYYNFFSMRIVITII